MNGKNIKNDNFKVTSDDGVFKFKLGRYIRNALGDIYKLTVKILANVSALNICHSLETSLPSSLEKLFS